MANKYGVLLGFAIISFKQSDTISIEGTTDKINNSKLNRYKQYTLANAMYDSINNMYLEKLGYSAK